MLSTIRKRAHGYFDIPQYDYKKKNLLFTNRLIKLAENNQINTVFAIQLSKKEHSIEFLNTLTWNVKFINKINTSNIQKLKKITKYFKIYKHSRNNEKQKIVNETFKNKSAEKSIYINKQVLFFQKLKKK